MIIKNASLDIVCGPSSTLPETGEIEIAFAGKSNVGKSTLINALMNRKSLARTSSQPGKTQTINFYHINEEFFLVDLPGYGYTTASVNVRQSWGRMIERYLKKSETLKAVFLLLDIRHEPNANDCQMYDWILDQGFHPIIIATKLDKIKRSQVQKQVKNIKNKLQMEKGGIVIPFSGQTKDGRDQIWKLIEDQFLSENTEAEVEETTSEE